MMLFRIETSLLWGEKNCAYRFPVDSSHFISFLLGGGGTEVMSHQYYCTYDITV